MDGWMDGVAEPGLCRRVANQPIDQSRPAKQPDQPGRAAKQPVRPAKPQTLPASGEPTRPGRLWNQPGVDVIHIHPLGRWVC